MNIKNRIIISLDKAKIGKYINNIIAIDNISLGHYRFWYKENFFTELPKKWTLSKIALLNDTPAGYCIVSAYSNKKAHIHRISIDPQFRRSGIGDMLMRHTFIEAFREGIVEITLESLHDNPVANLFYEKIGFKELNEREVNRYLVEKDKVLKSAKYRAINDSGNRLVFSTKINKIGQE